ncbi:helix-turn-helix domain-containing protein [Virgibacillus sp. Bac332]|uniref:helix-turn-helix domain-containing protein n=1 Tax=Virgibacillus sp. Bac332 TaxID=2419842 RepID=UPI001F09DD7B|nr:helix-turn-helix transcriptional regulator [Virgibacillus sp. Bac332]
MALKMTLGERLRLSRMRKNLTQIEAAKKLNISNNVLSSYERDARDPDTKMLRSLSELYNVSSDFLLGLSDHPERKSHERKSQLDNAFSEIVQELTNGSEHSIYINDGELDEETIKLVKKALKNGMKLVEEMRRDDE